MATTIVEARGDGPLDVVIAGGGVAALEALFALREHAGSRVRIELLTPTTEFVYRPMAVAEPFGLGQVRSFDLQPIATDQDARLRVDALASVNGSEHTVTTAGGDELSYGALLVAVGARGSEAVPGALTFAGPPSVDAFRELLAELENGEVESVAFVVPPVASWPLALYELALMTAAHLAAQHIHVEVTVVTHEAQPLGLFGRRAADTVRELLGNAGVRLVTGRRAIAAEPGKLLLEDGGAVTADRVVALPRLESPDIEGLPQGPSGFIPTDEHGKVDGLIDVFAAGDATWFPIKQGGVAAQQADAAAAAIAERAGADIDPRPFRAVLRGALLTGDGPRYMRSRIGERDASSASAQGVLWWPPSKIAGRFLAPYLVHSAGDQPSPPLDDLEGVHGEDAGQAEVDHRAAVELALTAADADAGWRDFNGALRWLDVAEQLNVVLPTEYADRRREWSRASPGHMLKAMP